MHFIEQFHPEEVESIKFIDLGIVFLDSFLHAHISLYM